MPLIWLSGAEALIACEEPLGDVERLGARSDCLLRGAVCCVTCVLWPFSSASVEREREKDRHRTGLRGVSPQLPTQLPRASSGIDLGGIRDETLAGGNGMDPC